MKKKVLLVSYLFPPTGGCGVQRALNFAKYLSDYGWDPVVLTVKAINYPVFDESLLRELPDSVEIARTGSLDPQRLSAWAVGNSKNQVSNQSVTLNSRFKDGSKALSLYRLFRELFAFPDPQIGWIPFAYWRGLRLIRQHKIEAIVVAMPPHSTAFIAKLLSWKTGIPYLLDLRDFWVGYEPLPRFSTRLHRWANRSLETCALRGASALVVFGEGLKSALRERYQRLAECEVIPNGFDTMDLDGVVSAARLSNKARVVYQGTLSRIHGECFATLLGALRTLPDKIRERLDIVFVGRVYIGAEKEVADAGLERIIRFAHYVPHKEALGYLQSADATLLFVAKNDRISVTGKVFEYLMVKSPIIACVEPEGACADVLRKAGCGAWISDPSDNRGLAETLTKLGQSGLPRPNSSAVDQFSRRVLTGRLAIVLDRIVAERATGGARRGDAQGVRQDGARFTGQTDE